MEEAKLLEIRESCWGMQRRGEDLREHERKRVRTGEEAEDGEQQEEDHRCDGAENEEGWDKSKGLLFAESAHGC